MKIKIHRGTHQIGGIAAEISTDNTRIIIDMGDELSLDPDFRSEPLVIPGVTDENGSCDAVLLPIITVTISDRWIVSERIFPCMPVLLQRILCCFHHSTAEKTQMNLKNV